MDRSFFAHAGAGGGEARRRSHVRAVLFTALALLLNLLPAGIATAATTILSANGQPWDVNDITDTDDGSIGDGGQDAFDDWGALRMRVLDENDAVLVTDTALGDFGLTHDGGRRWSTVTPTVTGTVQVSRGLFSPADSDYMRYIDSVTNTGTADRTVMLAWGGDLGSNGATNVTATSSGDRIIGCAGGGIPGCGGVTATSLDTWAATVETAGPLATDPPVASVFRNEQDTTYLGAGHFDDNPFLSLYPSSTGSVDELAFVFGFKLAPGESADLAYFLYRGLEEGATPPGGGAAPAAGSEVFKATTTATALAANPNFDDLTSAQRARIINWPFEVDSVTPNAVDPGTTLDVSIAGAGFEATPTVSFGAGIVVNSVTFVDSGELTANITVAPGAALGPRDVTVTNPGPGGHSATCGGCFVVTAQGYWFVGGDGGVFAFGSAGFHGSTGSLVLNRPIVGMAAHPDGEGYWFVASDGGVFAFGSAAFHGSTGSLVLNRPIVGMAATPTGEGYWLVASDGGIFAFGDAVFHGSTGSLVLNRPVVGMAATPSGDGYWFVASDGGIFAFGDAVFHGSTGSLVLNRPVVGMSATGSGDGYWFVASDGGIFAFGDAEFLGSTGSLVLNRPIVGMDSRA